MLCWLQVQRTLQRPINLGPKSPAMLRVEDGTFTDPSPIGFYFAKLWYFEKLYPIIFTVAALGRAVRAVA